MLYIFSIALIACSLNSIVSGQTAINHGTASTGFLSKPTEVAKPPIAEMIGSVEFFTEYVSMEGTTTKWINRLSSRIEVTATTPPYSQTTDVKHIDFAYKVDVDALILTSPKFRKLLEQGFAKTPKCPIAQSNIIPRGKVYLCGFNAFLNNTKDWVEIGRLRFLDDSSFLIDAFDTLAIGRGFTAALASLGEVPKVGGLDSAAYSFLWITWHLLSANPVFPPVLRIPERLFRQTPGLEVLCDKSSILNVSSTSFVSAVNKMCTSVSNNLTEISANEMAATRVLTTDATGANFFFQALMNMTTTSCPYSCVELYSLFVAEKTCINIEYENMATFGGFKLDCGTFVYRLSEGSGKTSTISSGKSVTSTGRTFATGVNSALRV